MQVPLTNEFAADKILDAKVAARESKMRIAEMIIFFLSGQFCACRGSSWLSNSTTYSSLSGRGGGYGLPPPKDGNGVPSPVVILVLPTVCEC